MGSATGDATLGAQTTTTYTITNDDSVAVEFSQAAGSDLEDVGGNLPVLLVTGTVVNATTVTVTDALTGSALSGTDYEFTSPQVVDIPVGVYDGTVATAIPIPTLSITGDADVEGDDTIDLVLGSATGDATLGAQTTTTYTINNDDIPTVTITASDDTATELGTTPGDFTVSLSAINNTGSDIEVNYSVGGTATPVDDYDALTGTVAIPTGQTSATIIVDPNDDNLTEPTETVEVTLDAGTGYTIGTPNTATVNIISEDDVPPSGYTVTIDQDPINSSNQDEVSFTFSGAPTFLTSYDYTFTSDGDGNVASVTGVGPVLSSNQTVNSIDLSSLQDGLITLTVTVSNVLGTEGPETSDTAVKLTTIPSGYTVSFDQDPIDQTNENNVSFTFSNAEVDATYNYTISSSGGGTDVIGNGTISSANQQISGIDLSGLPNGTITLSVILSNDNGAGAPATDTATKQTCFAGTTAPTLNGTSTEFCVEDLSDFSQDLDDYVDVTANLVWSTDPDPGQTGSHLTTSSVVSNPGTYYGFYYDAVNDCASPTVTVILSVNEEPNAGTTTAVSRCSDSSNGNTILDLDDQISDEDPGFWSLTSSVSGSSIIIDGSNIVNFVGQPDGEYIFTYTATALGICSDQTVELKVTVNDCSGPCDAGNVAPALNGGSSTIEFCDEVSANLNDYVISTPPSGTELIWSTSDEPSETGAHLNNPNVVSPGTYYGFYYDSVNDCGSPVLAITLERNFTPTIDSTSGDASCGSSILTLSASASVEDDSTINYTWYDAPTGGNIVGTSDTFTTNTLTETTSFYVTASANGCESERVEVVATIYEELSAGIPIEDLTVCNVSSDEGPTTFDLDDGLMGQDAGTWTIITDPSNGEATLNAENIVDFTGLPSGAYVFEYTTQPVGDCTETSSAQLTITVQDCISNETIDLAITKEVNDDEVLLDEEVRFTITVENMTTDRVEDIVVSDVLEDGFELLSSDPSKGNYDETTGEWTIDELVGEESATLDIRARVIELGTLTNTASLSSSLPIDDNPDNDTATVEVKVNRSQCEDPGTLCTIFSPNNDGDNDTLTLVGHTSYPNNSLEIFDRYGNSVFQMDGYDSSWDGTGKNGDLPNGTYFYILDLNGDGTDVVKGWIQIVR